MKDSPESRGTIPEKSIFRLSVSSPARRATLGTLASGVIGQLALLVSGIVSARLLGVEGRGYLALYVLFPTILVNVLGLGLPQALTYYIARNRSLVLAVTRQVYAVFVVQVSMIIIFQLAILAVYQSYDPKMDRAVGYMTIWVVPGMLAQQYGQSVLQGFSRFLVFNVTRLLMPIGYATAIVVLFVNGNGRLVDVAMAWVMATSASALITLVIVVRILKNTVHSLGETAIPGLGSILQFGLKGLFGSASPLEILRVDQFIAGVMLSPTILGLYVAAQSFMTLPRFVGQSVGMVAYPLMAAKSESNKVDIVWRIFRTVFAGNVIIVISLVVLMPWLLPLLFGQNFEDAVVPGQILLVAALFISVRRVLVEGARGLGFPQISSYAEFSLYPLLILGVFILVPPLGINGLAVSVTLGSGLALLVAFVLTGKLQGSIYGR